MEKEKLSILIIEDDDLMLNMLEDNLGKAGYRTVSASDGLAGLLKFKEHDYNLVILDLKLPKLDGVAVLKKMVDSGVMNHEQLVVAMVVTILFIPCVTNFMLIIKEQGSQKALAIIVSVTTCAILTGGIMNYVFRWAHISF